MFKFAPYAKDRRSHRYNPFDEVAAAPARRRYAEALRLANSLVEAKGKATESWVSGSREILAATAVVAHEKTLDMPPLKNVAVIGLGAGTLAAYARRGQTWTFYEDDPAERHIAENYFAYLKDSPVSPTLVTGDPRQTLAQAGEKKFDLIIVDTYTSDRVPVELLTREALQLYLGRLADTGVIAFHLTHPNFDLATVLAALAGDADSRAVAPTCR